MQIQHKGYFNLVNLRKAVIDFFKNLGFTNHYTSSGENPTNVEERIDFELGDSGTFGIEFRATDLMLYDRSPDIDKTELSSKLTDLAADGILISFVFETLKKLSTDYSFRNIRLQNDAEIIVTFEKNGLIGYIHISKKESSVILNYQPLKIDTIEDIVELNIISNLGAVQKVINASLENKD